ncbi:MAG: guanylate kinase [Dehalococcoidia bacterium]|nr:MAG: guanylate kinase [Dehalococcoidia bacterium]
MNPVNFQSTPPPNLLLIVSGSSGAGKDAVIERMKQLRLPVAHVVTATTRQQRPDEMDGIHYHFLSVERFDQMVEHGEMLEWASVYNNYYGVPRFAVVDALKSGKDVVVKVDVQGAATIRRAVPEAVLLFIRPPSMDELERRLRSRQSESSAEIAVRLGKAVHEYGQLPIFDYVLTNHAGRIDEVVDQVRAIITAEKLRVNPRRVDFGDSD